MNFEGRFSRFRFPRRFLQEEHSYFVKSLLNRFWFCLEMKIHRHSISLFPRNIVCIQTNLRKRPINKNKRQLTNFELPLLCPLLLLALLSAEVLRSVPFKLFCGVGEIGPLPVGIFLCFVSFPRRSYFSFLEPPTRARLSVICWWLLWIYCCYYGYFPLTFYSFTIFALTLRLMSQLTAEVSEVYPTFVWVLCVFLQFNSSTFDGACWLILSVFLSFRYYKYLITSLL